MENLELIISLASAAASLFIACAASIVRMVKAIKAKIKTEGVSAIFNVLAGFIESAEELTGLSGDEKLSYVLAEAENFALTHGYDFDEQEVSEKVEQLIELSKLVNVKH